ncbi:MAG TPA: dienelactone hydrolase family protein [Kiloniellales bacterium]
MGERIELTASDGHRLGAYLARPDGAAKAGLVICQEIFGVNAHIREVTDGFAGEGYLAIAPALFDRIEPGVELAYTADDTARGRALRTALAWDRVMLDVGAAAAEVRAGAGVGVVGYCWGGSLAWLAACRLPVAAAVGYYGGQIHEHRAETPNCPVLLHFGERDPIITKEHVAEIAALHPEVPIFTYDAGHGFNCTARADYDAEAAAVARWRTLDFLAQHLG